MRYIKTMHQKYLKMGLEGVVVKKANGGYVSGRTGWNWVKMKEEEGREGRLADTVEKRAQVKEWRNCGLSVIEIAIKMGISEASVYRALED